METTIMGLGFRVVRLGWECHLTESRLIPGLTPPKWHGTVELTPLKGGNSSRA